MNVNVSTSSPKAVTIENTPHDKKPLQPLNKSLTNNIIKTETLPKNIKPLRIALLGYRSHPFVGGQGIYLKYLSRALKNVGHEVCVFSGPPYPALDDDIPLIKVPSLDLYSYEKIHEGISFKHFRCYTDLVEIFSKVTGGFAEPYCFGRRVDKLLNTDKHGKFDIIHDNQSLCSALVNLQKKGHAVVSTLHHPIHRDRTLAVDSVKKWGEKLLVKRWYRFLNMQEKSVKELKHLITVSQTSQKDIEYYFNRDKHNTAVIFNGIDTNTFRPLTGVKRKNFHLLSTASSDQALKGLDILLRALKTVSKKHSQIHLEIIGRLKPGGKTEKLVKELDLSKHLSFSSEISTKDLVKKYNEASLVICPSLYEGFGLPAGEAMACGACVISSDGGALPEVVGNAGIIVEKGNHQAMSQAIIKALENNEHCEKIRIKARKRILDTFSWQKVANDLSHYYEKMLTNK